MRYFITLIENLNAAYDFHEMASEVASKIESEYNSGRYPFQPWKVVPAQRLIKIWQDHVKDGIVKDTKGLAYIEQIMIENTARIMFNNDIAGHSNGDPKEFASSYGLEFETDEEFEKFVEWAVDLPTGGWRISDYGLPKLIDLSIELLGETDDNQKLVIIDRMLNVTHPRSDLASWFVEGGTRTLNYLSQS